MTGLRTAVIIVFLAVGLGACTPVVIERGPETSTPMLKTATLVAPDGFHLPLKSWPLETGEPKAVVLALHGFNDYSNFFADPADMLKDFGIASYAYDQRGFGATKQAGYWHGGGTMARDARMAVRLIKAKHPAVPLYLLGSSMGGAVTIRAMTLSSDPLPVEGVILVAPAVWGRLTMPWYQTGSLWLASHTVPWLELTGRGLDIKPSDNYDMLRALGRDPLIIKSTRVDAIWGLVNLMDVALADADKVKGRILMLYGDRDDIVPKEPTLKMIKRLRNNSRAQAVIGFYQMGYHMLLRDLAAPTVLRDIAQWMTAPELALPSGADAWAARILNGEQATRK